MSRSIPGRQTALAQGGAKWGEFDREVRTLSSLATTGGVISSTGVCGLPLGGGIGWLMGKHGLSCDNVISADMVSADGYHLSASATQNEDLFWAIRGGGGNFGIVTALEFRLHPLDSVHGGIVLYPRSGAFDLLAALSRRHVERARRAHRLCRAPHSATAIPWPLSLCAIVDRTPSAPPMSARSSASRPRPPPT